MKKAYFVIGAVLSVVGISLIGGCQRQPGYNQAQPQTIVIQEDDDDDFDYFYVNGVKHKKHKKPKYFTKPTGNSYASSSKNTYRSTPTRSYTSSSSRSSYSSSRHR